MGKLTKNQKLALSKIDPGKAYTLNEAAEKVKEASFEKFDASLDIDVRLGVDPRKADQMVRGVVSLPHGTGKQVRVLVLCNPDAEAAAKEAGADYVGLDEYLQKIKEGWTDVDVIITQPSVMGKLGPLGRILGPRGLMPNPKSGTVTMDVAKAVKEVKQGKIDFKVDKTGIVHASIGKVSFAADAMRDNAKEFISTLPSVTGAFPMYSLILQVPAIMQRCSSSVTPTATAQASISKAPPATGVPALRPDFFAASSVTWPQISVEYRSGGSLSIHSESPKSFKSSGSYSPVCRLTRLQPE